MEIRLGEAIVPVRKLTAPDGRTYLEVVVPGSGVAQLRCLRLHGEKRLTKKVKARIREWYGG